MKTMASSITKKKILIAGLMVLFLAGCVPLDDIAFSRHVLEQLIKGRYAVRNAIDWDNFRALGQDVSAPYKALKREQAKIEFQRNFIDGFARGFREQKAELKAFYNWRYYKTTASKISIVVANCRTENVLFLFYVRPAAFGKKLVGINALIGNEPVRDIPPAFEDVNYFPVTAQEMHKQAIEQKVLQENLETEAADRIREDQQEAGGL